MWSFTLFLKSPQSENEIEFYLNEKHLLDASRKEDCCVQITYEILENPSQYTVWSLSYYIVVLCWILKWLWLSFKFSPWFLSVWIFFLQYTNNSYLIWIHMYHKILYSEASSLFEMLCNDLLLPIWDMFQMYSHNPKNV